MPPEEQALKYSRDLKNVIDTARENGYAEGYKEGLESERKINRDKWEKQVIVNMHIAHIELKVISRYSGMSIDEIKKIIDANSSI